MYFNKKLLFTFILITTFVLSMLSTINNINNVIAKEHNLFPDISSQSIGQSQSANQNLKCGSESNILPGSCINTSNQNQINAGSNNGY